MLFDIIYDYIYSLFNSNYINGLSTQVLGSTMSLATWLTTTITITIMIMLFIFICLVIRWVFRVFSGVIRAF